MKGRAVLWVAVFCLLCCGCGKKTAGEEEARSESMAEDLMRETREERMGEQDNREEEIAEEPEEIFYADAADFAIELLKGDRKGKDGDNVIDRKSVV